MKKLLAIGFVCVLGFAKAQTWKTEDQYIQKFAPYAVEEMENTKFLPVSRLLKDYWKPEADKADWLWKGKTISESNVRKNGRGKR